MNNSSEDPSDYESNDEEEDLEEGSEEESFEEDSGEDLVGVECFQCGNIFELMRYELAALELEDENPLCENCLEKSE